MEDSRLLNLYGAYDGQYIIVQSTNNACVSLRWFRDTFGSEAARQAQAAGCGIYPYLDRLADTAPAGGRRPYMASLSGRGAEPCLGYTGQGRVLWGRAGDRLPILYKGCPGGSGIFTAPLSGSGPGPGCQTGYHTPLAAARPTALCGAGYLPMCWEFPWPGSGPMRQRPWAISSSLPRLWESVRLRRTLERYWQRTGRCFGPMMSGLVYMIDSTGFTGNCTRR